MGLQRFPTKDYTGGWNARDNPAELKPNEAQLIRNCVLTDRGLLKQREGKTRFDISGSPGEKIDHMRRFDFSPSGRLVALSVNGRIYFSTPTGTVTHKFSGTAGTVWCFEVGLDGAGNVRLWAMNGVDPPQKFNSTGTPVAWAGDPPNGTMLRIWKNRMCISGVAAFPQRLYFSDIGNPETPVATYGTNHTDIKTTEDEVDPNTWLEIVGDNLLVFKKRSVWAVFDSNQFTNRRLGSPGAEDRFMSVEFEGRAYFFSRSGVYSVEPNGAPRYESGKIEPHVRRDINPSALNRVRMAVSRDRRIFVAVPSGLSSAENNELLELMPELRKADPEPPWSRHTYACSALCNFRASGRDILLSGTTNGRLHTLFDGTNDDGATIDAFWLSGWRGIITEEPFERLRRVNVEHDGRVVVCVYEDFDAQPWHCKVLEAPSGADPLWDGGPWEAPGAIWDSASGGTKLSRSRPESRARYHAISFGNNVKDKSFAIYTAEYALRGGKEH